MKKITLGLVLTCFFLMASASADLDGIIFYKISRSSGFTPPEYHFEKECVVTKHKVEIRINDINGERSLEESITFDPAWIGLIASASKGTVRPVQVPADADPEKNFVFHKQADDVIKQILLFGRDESSLGLENNSVTTYKLMGIISKLCEKQ